MLEQTESRAHLLRKYLNTNSNIAELQRSPHKHHQQKVRERAMDGSGRSTCDSRNPHVDHSNAYLMLKRAEGAGTYMPKRLAPQHVWEILYKDLIAFIVQLR
jgi:hypothetical protein